MKNNVTTLSITTVLRISGQSQKEYFLMAAQPSHYILILEFIGVHYKLL